MSIKFHTLLEVVAHWAEHTPDKTCLIDANSGRLMSYGEFWRSIRVFARRLQEAGLRKGGRVVVRVGPLMETLAAQFGVYLAGGVYCPVEKHMKEIKLLEMLDYFDSALLVSTESVGFNGQWIDLRAACEDGKLLGEYALPDPEEMCAIVFTTGTTGRAKGVMLRHEMSMNFSEMRRETYQLTSNDVLLWTNPLDRVAGIRAFGAAFIIGITAVYLDGIIFVADFFKALGQYKITTIIIQCAVLPLLLESNPEYFLPYTEQIRSIAFGGSRAPEKHKLHIQKVLPKTMVFVQYGSTEAAPVAIYNCSRHPGKANCVGKLLRNVAVSFIDHNGQLMTADADNPGIIVLEGRKIIMSGY